VTKANPKEAYVTAGNVHYVVNLIASDVPRALHHDVVIIQGGNIPDAEWSAVPSVSIVSVSSTSRQTFASVPVLVLRWVWIPVMAPRWV
jgi:hypothetical protein